MAAKPTSADSKLLRYTQIELKDSTDAYLESCFAAIQQNRYTMDSSLLLQIGETNKKHKEHISHALLYGILTDSASSEKFFHDLLLLNGTNLGSIISVLEPFIISNWRRIHESVRERLIWFLRKTLNANVDSIDRLYYVFLRQINPHESCLDLLETILELLLAHPLFLKTYPEMMLLTIYTFLSIFPIYLRRRAQPRHIDFILELTRENLHRIGRDAIRLLMQIAHRREIDLFLKHISSTSTPDYLPKILAMQTEPKYLALPLSFEMEKQLLFLFDNCRVGTQERYYFEWFQAQYLNFKQQPDAIFLCSHIIRYVCFVCRNQMNPTKITRWRFVSWLLTQLVNYQLSVQQTLIAASQTAMNAAAMTNSSSPQLIQIHEQIVQCRLAIFYDWLLFDQHQLQANNNEFDAQLNSAIVGYHMMATSYQYPKQLLLFLLYTSENFIVSLTPFLQQNLARLFFELFQRIPILNAPHLLQMFAHDRDIHQRLQTALFSLPQLSNTTMNVLPINDDVMIVNDDVSPNAAMPLSAEDESNDIMIMSANPPASSRFSDDEDDDDGYENRSHRNQMSDHDYDDEDVLMINDEAKQPADIYNISITRSVFPFDRFRPFINEHIQHLAMSYSSSHQNKFSLLDQIFKQISSSLSAKRPLLIVQPSEPAGPISSFALTKFEKSSEKFQSRLLANFDEQTIVNGLLCLWLLRDAFQNRVLPSNRISKSTESNGTTDDNVRELSPQKLKRSIKQSPVCVLFRLIREDRTNHEIYTKLLQSMFFFQPELASMYLYYLSIKVPDLKAAAELFDKFAKDIIKLSTSHRKLPIPPAKMPTYDQDFVDFLHEILSLSEQDDTETFLYLFSYVYRLYPKKLLNIIKLIRLLLHTINQTELEQFMCDILKHRLQFFHAHKLYSIVDQTLLFSQQEQEYFWQLLATHDFVQNDYEQLFTNVIEHLLNQSKSVIGEQRLTKSGNYKIHGNTIALANVYDILRTKLPTYGLVCCLFAHELTKDFSEKLCLLWNDQHHDIFWRHLERILQKWLQRENDTTKQKIDYKIGTIKMASDNGLTYILQHLQMLIEYQSNDIQEIRIDLDDSQNQLTIDDSQLNIPLSQSTIKSLVDCVHRDEQLYQQKKSFLDRFENGNPTVASAAGPHTTTTSVTTTTSTKRRKSENKS